MNIGTHLSAVRRTKGYSVKSLAESAGVAEGTLRTYEQGRRVPSAPALKKLLRALSIFDQREWPEEHVWVSRHLSQTFVLSRGAGYPVQKEAAPTNLRVLLVDLSDEDYRTVANLAERLRRPKLS